MTRSTLFPVLGAAALLGLVSACSGDKGEDKQVAAATPRQCPAVADTPVKLAGGTFAMGEDDVYAEEGPVRETTVAGFWIDPHGVTNRTFAAFVQATGSVTVARKPFDTTAFQVRADWKSTRLNSGSSFAP